MYGSVDRIRKGLPKLETGLYCHHYMTDMLKTHGYILDGVPPEILISALSFLRANHTLRPRADERYLCDFADVRPMEENADYLEAFKAYIRGRYQELFGRREGSCMHGALEPVTLPATRPAAPGCPEDQHLELLVSFCFYLARVLSVHGADLLAGLLLAVLRGQHKPTDTTGDPFIDAEVIRDV